MPGMVSPTVQPLHLGALNYLGQPITTGQLPGTAGLAGSGATTAIPDLTALSAAYGMQSIPGLVNTTSVLHPNQAMLIGSDLSNGMHTPTIQSKPCYRTLVLNIGWCIVTC